jgi:hypothetical protein
MCVSDLRVAQLQLSRSAGSFIFRANQLSYSEARLIHSGYIAKQRGSPHAAPERFELPRGSRTRGTGQPVARRHRPTMLISWANTAADLSRGRRVRLRIRVDTRLPGQRRWHVAADSKRRRSSRDLTPYGAAAPTCPGRSPRSFCQWTSQEPGTVQEFQSTVSPCWVPRSQQPPMHAHPSSNKTMPPRSSRFRD